MSPARRAVVIVGSGPAGAATALGIAARDPELATRCVLLEKAHHPRDKTCAGGVIPKAWALLARLGIAPSVPRAQVDAAEVAAPDAVVTLAGSDLCRVVRRRDFDAQLAWAARARGVELREDERVVHLARDGAGVRVETARGAFWAPVVVGADGSGSLVRRALVGDDGAPIGRAVMADVPVSATRWDGFAAHRYDFDFRACRAGLRGYRWVFPCLVGGVPHANVGVYSLPPVGGARLRAELEEEMTRVGARAEGWKAFPIRTWGPGSRVAAPNVLLVGDAAGVDPLMGEGISFALEYGLLAARAIADACARGDWSFAGYLREVRRGPGRKLARLALASRLFYGPRGRVFFRLAGVSRRAQALGLAWYNGTGPWRSRA